MCGLPNSHVSKPTISDAVRVLDNKSIVAKDFSSLDNRSYLIQFTELGRELVTKTYDFADPLRKQLGKFYEKELESLFHTLSELIYKLNISGILNVQRTCFGCKFYQKNSETDYCNLLQKKLLISEIRLDCPEYIEKASGLQRI